MASELKKRKRVTAADDHDDPRDGDYVDGGEDAEEASNGEEDDGEAEDDLTQRAKRPKLASSEKPKAKPKAKSKPASEAKSDLEAEDAKAIADAKKSRTDAFNSFLDEMDTAPKDTTARAAGGGFRSKPKGGASGARASKGGNGAPPPPVVVPWLDICNGMFRTKCTASAKWADEQQQRMELGHSELTKTYWCGCLADMDLKNNLLDIKKGQYIHLVIQNVKTQTLEIYQVYGEAEGVQVAFPWNPAAIATPCRLVENSDENDEGDDTGIDTL